MPFVWSIGTIIGPAIGGILAKPSETLPSLFAASGLFATFPYLLPNLVCIALLLISIVMGYLFLIETHPDKQPRSGPDARREHAVPHQTPLLAASGALADSGVDLRGESYGTFNAVQVHEEKHWFVNSDGSASPPAPLPVTTGKVFTKRVVMIIIALGIFTYHCMSYDHLLPIFLQDNRKKEAPSRSASAFSIPGGLAMSTSTVGFIMSINGLIALLIQGIIFPLCATWLSIWKLLILVTILHPLEYIMVPYLALLPRDLLYPGLWACLTFRNFTTILAYPLLLILLKEASPSSSVLGKINGLAASAAAACRCVAPPFAGYLYSVGSRQGFTGLAWWASGLVAFVGTVQVFWIERDQNKTSTVRSAAPYLTAVESEEPRDEVIHIHVNTVRV